MTENIRKDYINEETINYKLEFSLYDIFSKNIIKSKFGYLNSIDSQNEKIYIDIEIRKTKEERYSGSKFFYIISDQNAKKQLIYRSFFQESYYNFADEQYIIISLRKYLPELILLDTNPHEIKKYLLSRLFFINWGLPDDIEKEADWAFCFEDAVIDASIKFNSFNYSTFDNRTTIITFNILSKNKMVDFKNLLDILGLLEYVKFETANYMEVHFKFSDLMFLKNKNENKTDFFTH